MWVGQKKNLASHVKMDKINWINKNLQMEGFNFSIFSQVYVKFLKTCSKIFIDNILKEIFKKIVITCL